MLNRMHRARLKNGQVVHIRALRDGDEHAIQQMYAIASEKSLYLRYLRHTMPSDAETTQLLDLVRRKGAGFVAIVDDPWEKVVGYAYYVEESGKSFPSAEPAMFVIDEYQGLGLGKALIGALTEQAVSRGINHFTSVIDSSNTVMLSMIRNSGLKVSQVIEYGSYELVIQLSEQKQPVAKPVDTSKLKTQESPAWILNPRTS